MPSVLLVLPINGQYNENKQFQVWDSMINQEYNGKIIFKFVLESTQDPAYQHLLNYIQYKGYQLDQDMKIAISNYKIIKIKISGISYHNSQKIHNMLVGMQDEDYDYFISLDDDLSVNNQTVFNLISSLSNKQAQQQNIKISTGYSVEVPITLNITNYLVMIYRVINLLGFIQEKTSFIWGGCICFSKQTQIELKIEELWTDGCYSDDMSIGNKLKNYKYQIISPIQNMFINRITCNKFWKQYYNYVQRQYFVLTTYNTKKEAIINMIALLQLLFGGLIVLLFLSILLTDLIKEFLQVNIGSPFEIKSFDIKLCYCLLCIYLIGFSINKAIKSLEIFANSMQFKNEAHKLNNLLSGICLLLHFVFTPIMIFQILIQKHIKWNSSIYYIKNGRIKQIKRKKEEYFSTFDSMKYYLTQHLGFKQIIPDVKQRQQ